MPPGIPQAPAALIPRHYRPLRILIREGRDASFKCLARKKREFRDGKNQGSSRRQRAVHCFATFQTYRNVESAAVATLRPALRVARFSAERIFSLDSAISLKGTFRAAPSSS